MKSFVIALLSATLVAISHGNEAQGKRSEHTLQHHATAGEIYLSRIRPAKNISDLDFNSALFQCRLNIRSYENAKQANRIDKSNFITNRNVLARTYSRLLSFKETVNSDDEKVLLRELNNCGHLIRELVDQYTDTK